MSIDTSNECKALTELADFLKKEAEEPMSPDFRTKVIERFGEEAWNRHVDRKRKFDRASRIIAEIANVQVVKTFGSGSDSVMCDSSSDMVVKCRKIASEGLHNEHELKKCPFCGKRVLVSHSTVGGDYYSTGCEYCGYHSKWYKTEYEAIAANNRVCNAVEAHTQ